MKRIVAMLLVLSMLTGVLPCFAEPGEEQAIEETPAVTASAEAVTTAPETVKEGTETTEAPEVTEGTETTEASELTEGSETAEAPEVTEGSETAEASEVTEGTETAEAPEVTEGTETTEAPEVTEGTEITEAPEVTEGAEEPEESEAPEVTEGTEVSEEPETTVGLEASEIPEEAEVTEDTEPSEAPEVTEGAEAAEEPEVTESTEITEESEVSAETEVTAVLGAAEGTEPSEEPEAEEGEGLSTSPVDNSTTLPDGEYVPEGCTGGSSKVSFSCPKVTVKDGKATATFVISSDKYDYVKASGGKYETAAYSGGVYANIPVDLNADNRIVGHTTAMGGKEIEYTICITLDETVEEEEEGLTTSPVDNSTTLPDGEYVPEGCTGGSSKVSFSCPKVTVKDGKATATFVISSDKYDYVKASGGKYETKSYSGGGVYANIPVDLNADNRIVGHTTAMGGKEIEYTICVTLNETVEEEPAEDTGIEHTVETDNAMFKIVRSTLTLKDGKYTAVITLSGTGYDMLYCGTAAEAAADSANRITYSGTRDYDDAGQTKTGYVFTVPVAAVNEPIPMAAHSFKKDEWYDRSVTFTAEVGEEPAEEPAEDDGLTTSPVDSSTTLPDGEYVPEGCTGGSSKVSFSCPKVTVKDGKATATFVISSDKYDYVKASGGKYETKSYSDGGVYANIPVDLNADNRIVGHTTAMGGKEIEYTICITLNEAVEEDDGLTTSPVDNSTTLPDGEYVPEGCTGGSSKVSFSCPKVTVKDGKATATFVISSNKYDYVKASGGKYETAAYSDGGVYVNIPIDLNADNRIVGHTTAMGGKEIEYTIFITLDESVAEEDGLTTSPVDNSTTLPDGEYVPEGCTGGSSKVTFSCPKVTVKDGKAIATFVISSDKYDYVKASGGKYETAAYSGGGVYANIPVDLNADNRIVGHTTAMGGKEIEYTICITLDETAPEEPQEEPAEDIGSEIEHTVETDNAMFKIVRSTLTVKDGMYTAVITLSGTGYDMLYCGTAAEAAADSANRISYSGTYEYEDAGQTKTGYVFTIPVAAVNEAIPLAAHSVKKDEWYDRNVTFTAEVPEDTGTEVEHTVETDNAMFKIVRSTLTVKDGMYTAVITLSGTGYDMLYCGTAAEAAADTANRISYSGIYAYDTEEITKTTAEIKTGFVFNVPVAAVNEAIPLAAHSFKKDEWYDRNVIFTLVKNGPEPTPGPTAAPTASPTPTATPVILDTPGKVNNSTTLEDGIYTPDKFSWSGGSGRTSISCSKVTVRNGKAYATISFSSNSYSYVKASGSKYSGSIVGGRSTFEIPVNLNANNKIVGRTTAMSVDHEIAYTIYIYIAGAKDDPNESTDPEAQEAQIIGLNYISTDTPEYAKLFKIRHYEGGFTVIDMAQAGRYLIVPAGAEPPVGIEEEATVILQPVESVFVSGESVQQMLTQISGKTDITVTAWDYTAPDYAALLMGSCDLAVLPSVFAGENASVADVKERLALLGIPIFADHSAEEKTETAALEWIKVYGVLLNCEKEANAYYKEALAAQEA